MFTAPEGTIHTPNYPDGNYNNDSDCTWTISVDALHVVELNFTDFNVQSTAENCGDGYVMVSDNFCCRAFLIYFLSMNFNTIFAIQCYSYTFSFVLLGV